ncbi:MAG: Na+/H+ antiporter subunit C [Phycisphaeraceae bacterium]|nr:Na+/H+ antiporter subunit C [Phycisphaeraceae bacterium]
MELLLAVAVGALYATGIYMILRRSFVKLIIGLALISHGANLLIFAAGGLVRGNPALIPEGEQQLAPGYSDPLPPALILTAIVISFAILAFTIVLVNRTYKEVGTDDLNQMRTTDR